MNKVRLTLLAVAVLSYNTYADDNIKAKKPKEKDNSFWSIQTSVYTKHFNPNPDHNNHQDLIGIDYNRPNGWFYGGATFRNSFSQRSFYAYIGKKFEWEDTPFYARLSGGLIHGYHGKYKHKIPMNGLGIAPAIIPALGLQAYNVYVEGVLLGFNATMINVGYQFK